MHLYNNNNNNNNITVITLYAAYAHGHKPYIQIHNMVLTEKNKHIHVKTNKKNTTCTDRDTKRNVKNYISLRMALIVILNGYIALLTSGIMC